MMMIVSCYQLLNLIKLQNILYNTRVTLLAILRQRRKRHVQESAPTFCRLLVETFARIPRYFERGAATENALFIRACISMKVRIFRVIASVEKFFEQREVRSVEQV